MGWSVSVMQRARRLAPFAGVGALGLALVPAPGQAVDVADYLAALTLTLLVGLAIVLVPWARVPRDASLLPALVYLAAVALLRDAVGGAAGGVGSLVLLPVVWFALYGTRRQLLVVIAGVATVWALPVFVVGAPHYPASGWRGCALIVALSAVTGVTVQRLVARVREQAARLYERDRERAELLARVQVLAATDELTGVANRRTWNERLPRALAGAAPTGAVCVAVLDLDGFKALNDAQGHHAGDDALRDTARAWHAELRPGDTLARLGGDEFAVLLPDCDLASAQNVVDRLRAATRGGVTCSTGIVRWDGHETPDQLQARADVLLYQAKLRGPHRSATTHLQAI